MGDVVWLREYAGGFEATEEKVAKEMVRLLNRTRQNIIARLADIPGDRFEATHLKALMGQVDEALAGLGAEATGLLNGGSAQAYSQGAAVVDDVIAGTPLTLKMPMLTQELLNKALAFDADLIKNIGDEIRAKINTEIQLGVLGAKSPHDVQKAIGTNLKDPSIFRTIADRAETIARTEMGRVYSMATDERMRQVGEIAPGAKHFWIATPGPRTRDTHRAAGNRYSRANAIPIDQPFIVGGARLRYPRDPGGPAEETINCRCDRGLVLPEAI